MIAVGNNLLPSGFCAFSGVAAITQGEASLLSMNPSLNYSLPLTTPCKEWIGHRDKDGYGIAFKRKGKRVFAHRQAWEDANGPIPIGMCVCHKCDNPPCFESGHLFLGTSADNVRDAARKHKYSGERKAIAKLNDWKVKAIRFLWTNGINGKILAKTFGVHNSTIYRIVHRRIWTHV